MPWTECCISVSKDAAAAAERAFDELGALAITFEDAQDQPVLEPAPGTTPLWPSIRLRGLFDYGIDRTHVIKRLQDVIGAVRPELINWREVKDQDWERAWLERFRPMKFGRRLWIVPGGMKIPDDPNAVEIKLDPGLAFGTGTHPTTALCLEWLDGQDMDSRKVVDYGCGSGILGIAAARLGARSVHCVDTDPQAIEAAVANAKRNDVGEILRCCLPRSLDCSNADSVLANILAGPLVDLAPVLTACVRPGGWIILSGLLEEQREEVAAAYLETCDLLNSASREGWLRLDFRKSG